MDAAGARDGRRTEPLLGSLKVPPLALRSGNRNSRCVDQLISFTRLLHQMALATTCSSRVKAPPEFNAMLKFALRNGFFYFLAHVTAGDENKTGDHWSIISCLFRRQQLFLFPFASGVAEQLLSRATRTDSAPPPDVRRSPGRHSRRHRRAARNG